MLCDVLRSLQVALFYRPICEHPNGQRQLNTLHRTFYMYKLKTLVKLIDMNMKSLAIITNNAKKYTTQLSQCSYRCNRCLQLLPT